MPGLYEIIGILVVSVIVVIIARYANLGLGDRAPRPKKPADKGADGTS
jgi:hypothetical protein